MLVCKWEGHRRKLGDAAKVTPTAGLLEFAGVTHSLPGAVRAGAVRSFGAAPEARLLGTAARGIHKPKSSMLRFRGIVMVGANVAGPNLGYRLP